MLANLKIKLPHLSVHTINSSVLLNWWQRGHLACEKNCFNSCSLWRPGLTWKTLETLVPVNKSYDRVSTNLIKKFPGDSRRDFKKNPGHVCLASASYVVHRIYYYRYLMEHVMIMHFIQHGAVAKIK